MNLLKNAAVLAVVAFWALTTNHCGLETISGLPFLACSPPSEAASPHPSSDCGNDKDACATVESGLYKSEKSQIAAARVTVLPAGFAFAILCDLAALDQYLGQPSPDPSPPELARVWQFSSRAALPVRAPSFAS